MAYQSLYRKYRPQRFAELVGQEHVTGALRNAVRDGRVGHAYLFSGPRGTGKTTTARILAKALNCLSLGADGEPCGECDHCVAVAAGTFIDLFELDAASNRGVADARDLLERIAFRSATGGKKVYILDEVHMLTDAAANTLLKSLEEPPDHVVFVLATTNPEQVLPTIRSRTQHYEFTLLSTEQLATHLADVCAREGVEAEPDALAAIARAGAGSARDALSLLDQALAHAGGRLEASGVAALFGGSPFELRTRILRGIADGDAATVLVELAALLDAGHEPRRVAEDLLGAARDAFLLHAAAGRVAVDAPVEEQALLRDVAVALGNAATVRVIETLGQAVVDMRGVDAADPRLVLEVALVRLARREAAPPLVLLAERVERIERALQSGAVVAEGTSPESAPRAGAVPATRGAKPALGALRRAREAEGSAPPESEPSLPVRAPNPAPFDLDEVILAWAEMLPAFSPATRAAVQHAQPIEVDGDVVVFGIAPSMHKVAAPRFKEVADEVKPDFERRFGIRPRFRLVAAAEIDLEGAPASAAPAASSPGRSGPPRAEASGEDPPRALEAHDELNELDELDDVVDAEPAGPAVTSVGMLEAEFGATIVEERPRGAQEPS